MPAHARDISKYFFRSDRLPALKLSKDRLCGHVHVALLGGLVGAQLLRSWTGFLAGAQFGFLAGTMWHVGKVSRLPSPGERQLCATFGMDGFVRVVKLAR